MSSTIVETPFQVALNGRRGALHGECPGAVGKRLMDDTWREVQQSGVKTKGVNHWVYLPQSELFTGVELQDAGGAACGELESLDVVLPRFLQYVHVGPYSQLADVWPRLLAEIAQRGETPVFPNLEIYGHWNPDESKCETTILIGLQ